MRSLSPIAKAFIVLVVALGTAVLIDGLMRWKPAAKAEDLTVLILSLAASRLRVKLPALSGTMSVNLPFILIAAVEMSAAAALIVGCLSTLAQCLPRAPRKFNWVQALFNFANMAIVIGVTQSIYNSAALGSVIASRSLLLAVAAAGFFAMNTIPVAVIVGLTEDKNPLRAWVEMSKLSFPYYLASAGIIGVVLTVSVHVGWQALVVVLPLMVAIFYSYQRYFSVGLAQEQLTAADLG